MNFDQVVALLAKVNHIADARHETFKGRVKNFQRLGYPSGINTGRGRPALYLASHVLLLALAVEFTQFGLSPDYVVGVLESRAGTIIKAINRAAYWQGDALASADEHIHDVIIWFDPHGLFALSRASPEGNRISQMLHFSTADKVITDFSPGHFPRRAAFVNLSELIRMIAAEYSAVTPREQSFIDELHVEAERAIEASRADHNTMQDVAVRLILRVLTAHNVDKLDQAAVSAGLRQFQQEIADAAKAEGLPDGVYAFFQKATDGDPAKEAFLSEAPGLIAEYVRRIIAEDEQFSILEMLERSQTNALD